ncbi:MAG TPA: T9SS type A sorting domain-containing protein [Candidatus Krumholzibacteria bacterium]|nr:T9SS type A sorting domain-containing protein [Candidatus Krumholzibacteria bacterium]
MGLLIAAPVAAQVDWNNHIDASMVNDMVYRDGILYLATFGGLVLYDVDLNRFEQFDNVDTGLPSNQLRCLVFDDEDNLYIGTADFGVAKVRMSNGRPVLVRSLNAQIDGLSSNTINAIAKWGTDIVYGANPGAGTIRNDFASARYFERDGLPDDDVKDVLAENDDYTWIATNNGVVVLDRLGLLRQPTGAPVVANVLGTDGTMIWVGTNDGVRRFNPADSSWTDVGPDTRIMHGLYWDGTTMWGGSTRHLCRYTGTGEVWNQYPTTPVAVTYGFAAGGSSNQIRAMVKADDGMLYLGSVEQIEQRGANLLTFDGTTFTNLIPIAPGGNDIKRLSVDVDGSVWASFAPFYVGKLMPNGAWVNYNTAAGATEVPSNQFNNLALLADSQGFKWFCTLSRPTVTLDRLQDQTDANYGNDTWTRYGIDSGGGDGLGSLSFQRAVEDPAGNRWFLGDVSLSGTHGWQGIQILSRDGTEWFEMSPLKDNRMLSGDVVDVAFGSTFAYVAHRTAGIQLWALDGFDWPTLTDTAGDSWLTRVPSSALPSGAHVASIALRSDNVLWIATAEGLFRYPPSGTRPVDTIPVYTGIGAGILSPVVQDVLLDHDENLWVASNLGLNQIARDDVNAIKTYTTASTYVTALSDLRYPLSIISPMSHADSRALALHPTKDILYIGTLAGLTVLDYTPPAAAAADLSKIYLYPNPVYRSRGHNELMIQNITGPVSVEVYTVEGVLVHTQDVAANGEVVWDLTTKGGFLVGSGNYLVRVVGSDGAVTKTIAVLR